MKQRSVGKIPTPAFTVATLVKGGKTLDEAIEIVHRAGQIEHVRTDTLPTADEVRSFLSMHRLMLMKLAMGASLEAEAGRTLPFRINEVHASVERSRVAAFAMALLEAHHELN